MNQDRKVALNTSIYRKYRLFYGSKNSDRSERMLMIVASTFSVLRINLVVSEVEVVSTGIVPTSGVAAVVKKRASKVLERAPLGIVGMPSSMTSWG